MIGCPTVSDPSCSRVIRLDVLHSGQDLYYSSHYSRLEAIKQQYDPKNTFDFPTSIQ